MKPKQEHRDNLFWMTFYEVNNKKVFQTFHSDKIPKRQTTANLRHTLRPTILEIICGTSKPILRGILHRTNVECCWQAL